MTTPARLADFYRWLEAQDSVSVGRTPLTDEELGRLVRDYLAGRASWPHLPEERERRRA